MTRPVARLNDKTFGTCYHPSHSVPLRVKGRIITASPDTFVNNRPVARHGDKVKADCGHISKIISSIGSVNTNQAIGTARLNDRVGNGPYIARIITASPNVNEGSS